MPSASGIQRDPQPSPGGGPHVGPAGSPAAAPPAVLTAEQAHLSRSGEFLRLMREDVLSLRALGGDPVSEEYLKADLHRRAESLSDMPDTPLFFGRLDYAAWAGDAEDGIAGHRFHVGRRHVHDPDGHPVVIDWRGPVSRPFYRASPVEPMGLELRRRFGFSGGELTAFEDETFTRGGRAGPVPDVPVSRISAERDRAPTVRADAGHRGDDPA